jgi:hypothetical protein
MRRSLPKHAQAGEHQGARMAIEARVVTRLIYFLASFSIHVLYEHSPLCSCTLPYLFSMFSAVYALPDFSVSVQYRRWPAEEIQQLTPSQKLRQSLYLLSPAIDNQALICKERPL